MSRRFKIAILSDYVLINCVSTLIALPLFESDMLPAEKPVWEQLRAQHLAEIRAAFSALRPGQRVLLFCHDPTALPFLWRDERVQGKLSQIERNSTDARKLARHLRRRGTAPAAGPRSGSAPAYRIG